MKYPKRLWFRCRRHWTVFGAVFCIGAAVFGALVAFSLHAGLRQWQSADFLPSLTLASDRAWSSEALIPFSWMKSVFALQDDARYRETLRGIQASTEGKDVTRAMLRTHEGELRALLDEEQNPKRQSELLNLLGIFLLLGINDVSDDLSTIQLKVQEAAEVFREAIRTNPDNETAKRNLELLLWTRSSSLVNAPVPGSDDIGVPDTSPSGTGY